jgi:nicotinamide riboside transporter PnuC
VTQALAWLATMLGLVSTWQCGRRHRMGWLLGIACCVVWVAVNVELRLWAGIASAGIAAGLSARNWWAWR